MEEKLRGDRLKKGLSTLGDFGIQLRSYVQQRFYRLFSAFQHVRQCGDDCEVILVK